VSRDAVPDLADGLLAACGADTVAAEAAAIYRRRAVVVRPPWHRKSRFSPVPPADLAVVGQALRGLATSLGAQLPAPWPQHVRVAATAGLDKLPDELAGALSAARGPSPVTPVWSVLRWAWWFAAVGTMVTVVGGLSIWDWKQCVPLAAAGAAVTVALPALAAATGAVRARLYRRAVARRLRLAALTVAREVVAPVRQVLRDYEAAHVSLNVARNGRRPGHALD
jgi:hypothetical protein